MQMLCRWSKFGRTLRRNVWGISAGWVFSRLADAVQANQIVADNMNEYETSDEHQPVLWWRGYPVYAAHFLVVVFVASLFATVLANLFGVGQLLNGLVYLSDEVLRGEVWRVVTYGFVNPMGSTNQAWNFVMDMAIFIWFGREVEKHYGRRKFLVFYGIVYLITPLLFTLIGLWRPLVFSGEVGAMAVFIAFATLYPNVPVFFGVLSRWVAVILVAVYTLIAMNNRDEALLISMWATSTFAFAFVRYQQGLIAWPKVNLFRRGPKLRVLPDLKSEKTPAAKTERLVSSMAEVDALLDKIARSGLGSLTAKERAKLDAARADLLKKDSGRR